jgi:DNA polymerase elongation subunit (family B)
MVKAPRILFWDVETSYIIGATFSLRPDYIPHQNIIEDWSIICGSYKWQGEDKVTNVAVKKYGSDKEIVEKLRKVLVEADVIVHHNGDKFDVRKLNARIIHHGLEPLPKLNTIDTLKHIRKIAQFTSHRLDYLGQHLFGEGKMRTRDGLWMEVRNGSKSALQEMREYNNQDVLVLEKVYNHFLPYFQGTPHIGVIQGGEKCDCPKCGSLKMQKNGIRITAGGNKQQRLKCMECGSWHQIPIKQIK